jgi:hypothetical protein
MPAPEEIIIDDNGGPVIIITTKNPVNPVARAAAPPAGTKKPRRALKAMEAKGPALLALRGAASNEIARLAEGGMLNFEKASRSEKPYFAAVKTSSGSIDLLDKPFSLLVLSLDRGVFFAFQGKNGVAFGAKLPLRKSWTVTKDDEEWAATSTQDDSKLISIQFDNEPPISLDSELSAVAIYRAGRKKKRS